MLRPFLNVIDYYEFNGKTIDQNYFRSLVQYMNILGGLYLVDYLSETDIENKLKDRVEYYDTFGADVVKGIKKKRVNINSELRVLKNSDNKKYKLFINENNIGYFLNKKVNDIVRYKDDDYTILLIY